MRNEEMLLEKYALTKKYRNEAQTIYADLKKANIHEEAKDLIEEVEKKYLSLRTKLIEMGLLILNSE